MDNNRFLRVAFIISIVVVLNLFFNYTIYLLYPEPQYNTYCPQKQVETPATTEKACTDAGGQWTTNVGPKVAYDGTPMPAGYCNPDYTCSAEYTKASDVYARNVFVGLVVLGVLSLGASFFAASAPVVAAGLSYGGVLSLIIAAVRYWSHAQTILQVAILGVALVALLYLGARRFK